MAGASAFTVAVLAAVTNIATATPPAWVTAVIGTGDQTWWTVGGLVLLSVVLAMVAFHAVDRSAPTLGTVHLHLGAAQTPPVVARQGQLVIGDLPAQPPSFVTRHAVDELRTALRGGEGGVAVVCSLTGGRGVGKTQVAAAYARQRVQDGCPVVAWVSGETLPTLLADLAAVAEELGVADPEGDSERSALRLRDRLQSDPVAAVLVVDNATDPAALRRFLPSTGRCQVVITSTNHAFAEFGTVIEVPTFTPDESIAYLEGRTGLGDPAGAALVAEELDNLPVAIAQAPAVIQARRQTYREYLAALRRVDLDAVLPQGGGPYPRSTAQALILAIATAEDRDPTDLTTRLLTTIALLAPEGISRDLLQQLIGPPATVDEVAQRLGELTSTSLLTWAADRATTITAHRLTSRVLRERSRHHGTFAAEATTLIAALNDLLPPEDAAWPTRQESAELIPHITSLWSHLVHTHRTARPIPDGLPLEPGARLMNRTVLHLETTADLSAAITLGTALLDETQEILGPDHLDTLNSRNNLANAYQDAGQLNQAVTFLQHNLTDTERVLGPNHPNTLASRHNLAYSYWKAGQLDHAITLFQHNLTDTERVLGPNHLHTLISRNNLATAYRQAGQLDHAITLHQQNLTHRERVLGPNHPHTLISRNNLATAYQDAGQLDHAITLHQQNLTHRERVLGPDHPDTLGSRNNLAYSYWKAGQLDHAITLCEHNLAAAMRVLPPEHPHLCLITDNLAAARKAAETA